MGWQLKPLESILAQIPVASSDAKLTANSDFSLSLEIQDTQACPRVAALVCDDITHKASQIWMAMRLARVDSKPINTIVDITNYVMFDLSQPMHVFDAANFPDKKLTVRTAQATEKLELLDGHQISLTENDIVITDGKNPVALAGVMGGKQASFTQKAQAIIIEAGAFQASMVRNSATRVKVTTEASTRFSKQLDPMQNTVALQRFVYLAQALGVVGFVQEQLISVGKVIQPSIITVKHSFIQSRLGVQIPSERIIAILKTLEISVTTQAQDQDIVYQVTVPTLRITKDLTIPEDIVEEVARLYGFENITYQRPVRAMKSFDIEPVMRLRNIKEHCAFSMKMREVRDYLFYDESFLKRLGWYPIDAVAIKNPVSENWKVLVTSLVPHLIKNVELNMHGHEQIRFFEHNSVWQELSSGQSFEQKSFAGIFFGDKNMNFYDYKAELQGLFKAIDFPIVWAKCIGSVEPWFDQLQAADIMLDLSAQASPEAMPGMAKNGHIKIGRAGMLHASFVRSVVKGSGFVFEFNAELLLNYKVAAKKFTAWSKYQSVSVDISMLIDLSVTAENLEKLILQADEKIDRVSLLDFFEKDSWAGKKSLTFRYRISDFEQNLTKEVIENVTHKVTQIMVDQGAQVR
jgi:phenylalanyl-tRNA synthetase beta chain